MPGPAVVILMLVLVAAIVGASLVIGAPYLALPIVFLALVIWGGARVSTARGRREILDDREERIEFTEEDRRTLTPPSATPPGRPGSEPAG
jgi:membrane protein implicated in regulation of membrane protease activity